MGRNGQWSLPNILLDYLYRFEWEADDYCQGSAVHFFRILFQHQTVLNGFSMNLPREIIHMNSLPLILFKMPASMRLKLISGIQPAALSIRPGRLRYSPYLNRIWAPISLSAKEHSDTLYANCDADFYSWNGIPGISPVHRFRQRLLPGDGFFPTKRVAAVVIPSMLAFTRQF